MRALVALLCAAALAWSAHKVSVSEPKPYMDRPFKPPAESQQLKAARERWEARRDAWVAELGGDPLSIMGKETEDESYRIYERLRKEDYQRRQATYDNEEAFLLKEYLDWENIPAPPDKAWATPLAATAGVAAVLALVRPTRGLACLFAGGGNAAVLVLCLQSGRTKDVFGFDAVGLGTFVACTISAWAGLFTGLCYFNAGGGRRAAAAAKKRA